MHKKVKGRSQHTKRIQRFREINIKTKSASGIRQQATGNRHNIGDGTALHGWQQWKGRWRNGQGHNLLFIPLITQPTFENAMTLLVQSQRKETTGNDVYNTIHKQTDNNEEDAGFGTLLTTSCHGLCVRISLQDKIEQQHTHYWYDDMNLLKGVACTTLAQVFCYQASLGSLYPKGRWKVQDTVPRLYLPG